MASSAALDITIRKLTKTYGAVRALDEVDLDIHAGEFLTLLGPSGSGKTTLLMALAGFLRPDRGSILFGSQEVIRLAPHKRNVGMVFQNYALFPHMDVARNIAYPLRLRKVPAADIAQRVEAALDMVQLGGYGTRNIDQLSGGQRQRVALARAIVFEPRIILMDEPLSALDKQLRERMQIELRQLHEKLGATTIYVTHDQREALTMSDRIAVINGGRVVRLDTPRQIYERPGSRFVAEFIGESTFLEVQTAGGISRCAGAEIQPAGGTAPAGRSLLMVRPERLRIIDGSETGPLNRFKGKVTNSVYQGDTILLQVTLGDGSPLNVRLMSSGSEATPFPIGAPITLGLPIPDTVVLEDDKDRTA